MRAHLAGVAVHQVVAAWLEAGCLVGDIHEVKHRLQCHTRKAGRHPDEMINLRVLLRRHGKYVGAAPPPEQPHGPATASSASQSIPRLRKTAQATPPAHLQGLRLEEAAAESAAVW